MSERDPLKEHLFDTSNFWEFQRQFVVDAIIGKSFPDYALAIISIDEKLMQIPEQKRRNIQYHKARLSFMGSLSEMEKYCLACDLKFLTPEEIIVTREQGATLLLNFDTRTKEMEMRERKESGEPADEFKNKPN